VSVWLLALKIVGVIAAFSLAAIIALVALLFFLHWTSLDEF
jgi:hypothetical protein